MLEGFYFFMSNAGAHSNWPFFTVSIWELQVKELCLFFVLKGFGSYFFVRLCVVDTFHPYGCSMWL